MFTVNVYRSCMMILSNLFFAINWIESASGLVIHITTKLGYSWLKKDQMYLENDIPQSFSHTIDNLPLQSSREITVCSLYNVPQ